MSNLFQSAQAEYIDVLLAQRDLMEARTVLVQTKQRQLAAIVNAYQALGGGGAPTVNTGAGAPEGQREAIEAVPAQDDSGLNLNRAEAVEALPVPAADGTQNK